MNLSNSNISSIYKTDINSDTKGISSLYRINTENGYIQKNALGHYEIIYYLENHLGNVMFEVGLDNKIKEQTNYYPFGMEWNKSSEIEYAYNCATFASDDLKQDKDVKVSGTIINTPVNIANSYRSNYDEVDYRSKNKSITVTPHRSNMQKFKDIFLF